MDMETPRTFLTLEIKMRRLVYSPSIKCWIKTDTGTIDLSPYIVNCSISRKIDDVSSAEIEFRNPKIMKNGKPKFMFTDNEVDGKNLPVFHPMDPITIVLERIQGKPIQVFTGYCDSTPDIQLFPGTAKIKASCTLKRLLYTYWDPALPFVTKFMQNYGWGLDQTSGVANKPDAEDDTGKPVNKLNDSSIANMLYATLNEVGGWDDKNIFIQELPLNLVPMVTKLFDEIVKDNESLTKEVGKFIDDIIGSGNYGSSIANGGVNGSVNTGNLNSGGRAPEWIEKIIADASNKYGVDAKLIRAQMRAESNFDPNATGAANIVGLMQVSTLYCFQQSGYTPEEVSTDNRKNVYAGVAEMKTYLQNHNGNIPLALADYNAGPTGSKQHYTETVNYVKKICQELGISTSPYV